MDDAQTHDSPDQSGERLLAVLHDALHQHAPLNATIGDIVLTDRAFRFLRYHDFQFSGSLGEGAGFLLGGVAGAIAVSVGDRGSLKTAREMAKERRSKLFGFPLKDRVARLPDSVAHSSDTIERLRISDDGELSVLLRSGERLAFYVPTTSAELRAAVDDWPRSESRYDREGDPDGFFVGSASPGELLDRAGAGDSSAASELHELARRPEYAVALYSELGTKAADERRALLGVLAQGPPEFREALLAVARRESIDGLGKIIGGLLGIPVFGFLLGAVAITQESILAWIFAALMVLMAGGYAAIGVGERRRARETREFLQ